MTKGLDSYIEANILVQLTRGNISITKSLYFIISRYQKEFVFIRYSSRSGIV